MQEALIKTRGKALVGCTTVAIIAVAVGGVVVNLILAVALSPISTAFMVPALLVFAFGMVTAGSVLRQQAEARLARTGIRGLAEVIGADRTSTKINGQPLVVFKLRVSIADRPPYKVIHRDLAESGQLGRYARAKRVPVYVDRRDPRRMVVDWEAAFGNPDLPTRARSPWKAYLVALLVTAVTLALSGAMAAAFFVVVFWDETQRLVEGPLTGLGVQ